MSWKETKMREHQLAKKLQEIAMGSTSSNAYSEWQSFTSEERQRQRNKKYYGSADPTHESSPLSQDPNPVSDKDDSSEIGELVRPEARLFQQYAMNIS